MNDTSLEIAARMEEMILRKPPEERLRMGCSMFDFSRILLISGILRENPGVSPAFLRAELFRRFSGSDFDPLQQGNILKHLLEAAVSSLEK